MSTDKEGLTIRDARPDERDAIAALTLAAYAPYAQTMTPTAWAGLDGALREALASDAPMDRIVAEQNGELLGSVQLYPPASEAYGDLSGQVPWPEVRLLAVAASARGQGISRPLMAECTHRARAAGATEIGVHTSPSMAIAMAMYVRMGFVRAPQYDFQPAQGELVQAYYLPFPKSDDEKAGTSE